MNRVVKALLKNAASGSAAVQTAAAFQLGMLFEKNTRPSDEIGLYESALSPDIAEIRLDIPAQAEVLRQLVRSLATKRVPSTVFWATGKASPEAGAPVLVELLAQHSDLGEDLETAYQAVIALENCLDYDREVGRTEQAETLFRNETVIRFLRQASSASDPRLAEHAPRLLKRLTGPAHGRRS